MNLRDENLRAAYGATAAPRGVHPDSEALVRAAEGTLPPDERDAVAAHLETCAPCAADVRVAFEALGAPSRPERRGVPRAWLALAASVLLSAGIVLVLSRGRSPSAGSGDRGPAAERLSVPADGATLATPPAELRWESAPAAEEYTLLVYDAESRLLWTSPPSKNPRVTLPPDVRGRLSGGSRYLWRVRYVRGFETLESPVFRFVLSPPR